MKKFILLLITAILLLPNKSIFTQDIKGKLIVGYQGWFNCEGDESPSSKWVHWGGSPPSPGAVHFDLYPDVREYSTTYQTGLANLGNGQPAKLFSSYDDQVVNKHFEWMQTYGIDCAALQRFGNAYSSTESMGHKNGVALKVKNAAQTYGRKFYIMYDISDWSSFQTQIKADWTYTIVGTLNLTASPAYAKEMVGTESKPVVCFWGVGSEGRPGNNTTWTDVINWFKQQGCYVIVGGNKDWRTTTTPLCKTSFEAANMISPWHVGTFGASSIDSWATKIKEDMIHCKSLGIDYMPVLWPGFSWANWKLGYEDKPNSTPRNHGTFMWDQFYQAKLKFTEADITATTYVAMFDEYDEGTAIAKAAENSSMRPTNQWFLTLDYDGTACSSDFYLRLVGDAAKMVKGEIGLTAEHPTAHVLPTPANNAEFISTSVPTKLKIGQTATVSVTMKNTGTMTWKKTGLYQLGIQSDSMIWGIKRVALINDADSIVPNASKTFTFTITAPISQGVYNFQWRMVKDNNSWFGYNSSNEKIEVIDTSYNAAFISQSNIPNQYIIGQIDTVSITMKNTGTRIWTKAGLYKLGIQNNKDSLIWGIKQVELNVLDSIKPDSTKTFTFIITAPVVKGVYNFQWRMNQANLGWFGDTSINKVISVIDTSYTDYTNPPGKGIITSRNNYKIDESDIMAFDNLTSTKWLDAGGIPSTEFPSWIQIQLPTAVVVKTLSITSANDASDRDPKDFSLKASNNGTNWTTLSSWYGVIWTKRFEEITFSFPNNESFNYYRIETTKNAGNIDKTQLSEIELINKVKNIVPVTGVALSPVTAKLSIDKTKQLTAIVSPTNAFNKKVSWATNNPAIASVSSNGLVTAITAGTATITVTTEDGLKTATSVITVTGTNDIHSISQKQSVSIYPNPLNQDILTIKLDGYKELDNIEVIITNLQGQMVYRNSTRANNTMQINTSGMLKSSVYFVTVKSGQSINNTKLIVR